MMTAPATPDGLLLVDKPAGVSSHDMVLAARRAVRERRIGHAGTLDPFATGLLVLLVGRATRLLPHLSGEPKVYEATIVFGSATDTDDVGGAVVDTGPLPTQRAIRDAIPALTGPLQQVPSAYSAKRVDGRRAYDLARAGVAVELAPAAITVHGWEIIGAVGQDDAVSELAVRVTCSGGTYVRALARDLGRAVGSAAHLRALRRVASGPFRVEEAVTLAALRDGAVRLRPPADALPHLPVERLTEEQVARVVRGIAVEAAAAGPWARLVHIDTGVLVALGERRDDQWQPRVVMRPAVEGA
jgi:tRNA pseudouridine55 synthase